MSFLHAKGNAFVLDSKIFAEFALRCKILALGSEQESLHILVMGTGKIDWISIGCECCAESEHSRDDVVELLARKVYEKALMRRV